MRNLACARSCPPPLWRCAVLGLRVRQSLVHRSSESVKVCKVSSSAAARTTRKLHRFEKPLSPVLLSITTVFEWSVYTYVVHRVLLCFISLSPHARTFRRVARAVRICGFWYTLFIYMQQMFGLIMNGSCLACGPRVYTSMLPADAAGAAGGAHHWHRGWPQHSHPSSRACPPS